MKNRVNVDEAIGVLEMYHKIKSSDITRNIHYNGASSYYDINLYISDDYGKQGFGYITIESISTNDEFSIIWGNLSYFLDFDEDKKEETIRDLDKKNCRESESVTYILDDMVHTAKGNGDLYLREEDKSE